MLRRQVMKPAVPEDQRFGEEDELIKLRQIVEKNNLPLFFIRGLRW